jgi:hypothetical protein
MPPRDPDRNLLRAARPTVCRAKIIQAPADLVGQYCIVMFDDDGDAWVPQVVPA